jgi:hypothetical protein
MMPPQWKTSPRIISAATPTVTVLVTLADVKVRA